MAVLVKNYGGRRRASTRTGSGFDRRWRQAPFAAIRDKGGSTLVVAACDMTSTRAILGCGRRRILPRPSQAVMYRPTFMRAIIAAMIPWLFLPSGEGGAITCEGVICCHFGSWRCVNHGPSTVETSLDVRGSADERPANRGCHQKQNKYHTPCRML